jgi:Cu2+-exporting ATPase
MEFEVRHSIPGRVRLKSPVLNTPSRLADAVADWFAGQEWVVSVRVNHGASSLVLKYDRARPGPLVNALQLLAGFSRDDLWKVVERPRAPPLAAGGRIAYAPPPRRSPLTLPTLSLALAFWPGPVSVTINTPLMLYCGLPIFRRAFRVIRRERRLNIDFLDTLAIGASILQGNMLAGGVITWLIRFGDWIRDLTAAGAKRAATELLDFQTKRAWVEREGMIQAVPASDLAIGDLVVAYPGEMIPVDGEIIDGAALIDQKTITGESLPVSRGTGEAVFAATIVGQGQLKVRATRVGAQTTAGQIAHLVDSAPIGDTRMQNHAEKFADQLVLPTLGLAVGSAALTADFNRFLSLVIVDYGTGIRVAAPTTVLASMTQAARSGIIIKSGGHMEKLAEVDTVVFDKTGTLSHGVPNVVGVSSYHPHIPDDHLLALAVAAETNFSHPVAEALRTKLAEFDLQLPPAEDMTYQVGLGVEGRVNGYYVHVGSERFLKQNGIRLDVAASDEQRAIEGGGRSCLHIAADGQFAGLIAYEDRLRGESREVVRALHGMGVRETIMLTGDNARVASAVGRRLGLTRQESDMMPSDKVEVVRSLQRDGRRVAMIGDGINDSPALSFADVGIAMRHGADITHEAADVVLMEDSLWKLAKAIEISRSAVGLIKQNYAIVAAMNTVALGLALPGGLISPVVTALISNGSAVLASLNGMRPALRP